MAIPAGGKLAPTPDYGGADETPVPAAAARAPFGYPLAGDTWGDAERWATTYFPLGQYGLKLRFVDIDRETLNYDLDALAGAIDDEVSVISAVNLLGNPNDYDAIGRLTEGRKITLLEDNRQSMGARFGGRFAGTFGAVGTFSTFYSHHISTMDDGDLDRLHAVIATAVGTPSA